MHGAIVDGDGNDNDMNDMMLCRTIICARRRRSTMEEIRRHYGLFNYEHEQRICNGKTAAVAVAVAAV